MTSVVAARPPLEGHAVGDASARDPEETPTGRRRGASAETRVSGGATRRAPASTREEAGATRISGGGFGPLDDTLARDEAAPGVARVDLHRDRIGRFVVLSKIGEGGMGAVYSAYDVDLDRRVALKLLRESAGLDTLGHARMLREAQAMARLSHPNVVQIYEVGSHDEQIFIAMEHVKGTTLREWEEGRAKATAADRRAILDVYIQAGRGLAAAHRAGMVHRDFKPDNVLVGDDGRARVLDFGIAASIGEAASASSSSLGGAGVATGLTRTGAVLGTPAFMAPELFLAEPSDARTDQFSFCVALYRALYGAAPFAGSNFGQLQAAVCDGVIEAPPAGSGVPPWLRAVLVRGLARRPDDRHVDMDALLVALQSDPDEVRRRRLRGLARFALALGASAALFYASTHLWGIWARRRDELAAAVRLERMEARVAELVAAGDRSSAARIFDAFVRSPDNQGRAALHLAWLHHAERAGADGDHASARAAYAASFAAATAPEHELDALTALIRWFRGEFRWNGVVQAVGVLEARAPGAFADADLRDAQIVAATTRRDFEAAAAAIEGLAESPRKRRLARLIAAMTPAHLAVSERGHAVPGDFGAAPEIAYLRSTKDGHDDLVRVGLSLDLPVVGIERGDHVWWHAYPVAPGEPARYTALDRVTGEVVLMQAKGAALEILTRFDDHVVLSTASGDLDGDGVREHFLGTGPYTRHLVELLANADGSWSTRASAPTLDARSSDIRSLFTADLDGDGDGELVAGLGPWIGYEVHVLGRERASDDFTTLARARLGALFVAPLRRHGGVEIAALVSGGYTNPGLFPPDKPLGEARGLYRFRLAGDRLVQTGFSALGGPAGEIFEYIEVGDLDGDGVSEVVAVQNVPPGAAPFRTVALVYSLDDDGVFDVIPLAGVVPMALRDLDGDGDDELVALVDDAALWVIGGGAERLPAAPEAIDAIDPAPAMAGPLGDEWARARELAQMGLQAEAADAFVALADAAAATDGGLASRATLQAARLHRGLGDDGRAAALFARAADEPALAEDASAAAIQALRSRGDVDEVRALLDLFAAGSTIPTEVVARERAALEDFLADRLDLRFDRPLDRLWRIDAPLALSRDPLAATVDVNATGTMSIATLPITAGGGEEDLVLEVDIDVERLEWGGDLSLSLGPPGSDPRALAVSIYARGGEAEQTYTVLCASGPLDAGFAEFVDLRHPKPLGRRRIRAVVRPARGELTCTAVDAAGVERHARVAIASAQVPRLDRGELRISTQAVAEGAPMVSAKLHSVSVIGAAIGDHVGEPPQPLEEARRALVEGDYAGALAALDAEASAAADGDALASDRALWRLAALLRLGRWPEATALARAWLGDADRRGRIDAGLGLLLRREPDALLGLLRAVEEPAALRRRVIDGWSGAFSMRRYEPAAVDVLRRYLEDYRPASDEDPAAVASLLELRAKLHAVLGRAAHARRDFGEARVYLARTPVDDPNRRGRRQVSLMIDEATQAARVGDEAAARALVADALRIPYQIAFVEDLVAARAELAALRADPR